MPVAYMLLVLKTRVCAVYEFAAATDLSKAAGVQKEN